MLLGGGSFRLGGHYLAMVLETGRLVVSGRPDELWNNPKVRAAYLGGNAGAVVISRPMANHALGMKPGVPETVHVG